LAPPNEKKPQTAAAKIGLMTRMWRSRLAVIDGPIGNREFCNLTLQLSSEGKSCSARVRLKPPFRISINNTVSLLGKRGLLYRKFRFALLAAYLFIFRPLGCSHLNRLHGFTLCIGNTLLKSAIIKPSELLPTARLLLCDADAGHFQNYFQPNWVFSREENTITQAKSAVRRANPARRVERQLAVIKLDD
jgi:hypothetical protein